MVKKTWIQNIEELKDVKSINDVPEIKQVRNMSIITFWVVSFPKQTYMSCVCSIICTVPPETCQIHACWTS